MNKTGTQSDNTRDNQDTPVSDDLVLDKNELEYLESLFQHHSYEELVHRVSKHLQKFPSAFFLYNILGLGLSGLGNFNAALESYRRVLDFQPDNTSTLSNIGFAYLNLNDFENAIHYYEKAIATNPDLLGIHKNIGIALNNLDRYEEAIESYLVALKETPEDDELVTNLGVAYDNNNQPEEALQYYKKALKMNPHNFITLYRMGCLYQNQGQVKQAQGMFEDALRLNARNLDLLMNLGILHNNQDNWDAAAGYFKSAIELDPNNPKAFACLGAVLQNMEQYEEALHYYDLSIELNDQQPEYFYRKGICLYKCELLESAYESFKHAVALAPDHAGALHYVGRCLIEMGSSQEAFSYLEKAIKLDENEISSHFCMGCLHLELHDYLKAKGSFERINEIDPDFPDAYNQLGIVHRKLGNNVLAAEYFQKALDLDPETEHHLENFASSMAILTQFKLGPRIKKHIKLCLDHPNISGTKVSHIVNEILLRDLADITINKDTTLTELESINKKTDGLLLSYLNGSIITNLKIEAIATALRWRLLQLATSDLHLLNSSKELSALLEGLTYQALLNEHIWHTTEEEIHLLKAVGHNLLTDLQNNVTPDYCSLLLLTSYNYIDAHPQIKEWALEAYENSNQPVKQLLEKTVIEPEREITLTQSIETITPIENDTSVKVKAQYEEHPYPRWNNLALAKPVTYFQHIEQEIYPNQIVHSETVATPKVLIAGCGTGQQPISSAYRYKNSDVLAIDLSMRSLGYAKRKALELNVHNIRFAQADILKLSCLEEKFDVIECAGVLHHMAEPDTALQVLLQLLKPNGYLKLGLYSSIARETFADLTEQANALKLQFPEATTQELRQKLIHSFADKPEKVSILADFFTTSSVRDLFFHAHEKTYNIQQIADMLAANSLELLGFSFQHPQAKLSFMDMFPEDPECIKLENWDEFEKINPMTFIEMYQLWCRPYGS